MKAQEQQKRRFIPEQQKINQITSIENEEYTLFDICLDVSNAISYCTISHSVIAKRI